LKPIICLYAEHYNLTIAYSYQILDVEE
jgi:hypothetical protein